MDKIRRRRYTGRTSGRRVFLKVFAITLLCLVMIALGFFGAEIISAMGGRLFGVI